MIDVVFAVAFAALLIATLVVLRSAAAAAILIAAGVGLSGVILQFAGISGLDATLRTVQVWLLVTFVVILAVAVLGRRRSPVRAMSRTSALLVLGSSAAVAVLLLVTRMLAPGAPGPLTAVGYLISRSSAQDNAKWPTPAAELASGCRYRRTATSVMISSVPTDLL